MDRTFAQIDAAICTDTGSSSPSGLVSGVAVRTATTMGSLIASTMYLVAQDGVVSNTSFLPFAAHLESGTAATFFGSNRTSIPFLMR
jgi:hypothetical protein